jgi:hypothetical protein
MTEYYLHEYILALWGMPLGDQERLAAKCKEKNIYILLQQYARKCARRCELARQWAGNFLMLNQFHNLLLASLSFHISKLLNLGYFHNLTRVHIPPTKSV